MLYSLMVTNAFTWVFLLALGLATATRLWLALRQIRHVRAHRDAVPSTFAEAIPLPAHQKAADYTVAKEQLGILDTLLDAAIVLAFTLGGVLQWLIDQWALIFPIQSLWHGAAIIVTVILLRSALGLPLTLYRIFVIEEQFGFNRMTWKLFLADLAKTLGVAIVLGAPLLLAILWLASAAGKYWWFYAWILLTAYSIFLHIVIPTFISPLFNKFSPVKDAGLAERIERLLSRCGFRSRGLYVMDGSKRSAHGNAYFTGLGASKRIVLFDTLVSRLQPPEIEAVLAHELGHYKLRHITKALILRSALSLLFLFVLGFLVDQQWFYEGLGVRTITFPTALVLFLLAAPAFMFVLEPLMSLYSRKNEFEADRYAVSHAEASELVTALVKLYKDNAATLTPDPLHSAFYDSHPPAATRIARLRTT